MEATQTLMSSEIRIWAPDLCKDTWMYQLPKALPNFLNMGDLPHCLVGDEAFPLRMDLMRPYPRAARAALPQDQLVFNYRLSRARRIVENTFGILAQRFRIYNKRMQLSDYNADIIIKATCTLHNFLTENIPIRAIENQLNPNQEPYLGRDGAMQPIQNLHGHLQTVFQQ